MEEKVADPFLPKMLQMDDGSFAPAAPTNAQSTGVDRALLLDLALKTAYVLPQFSTEQAAKRLHLPQVLVAELLEQLRTDMMIEALGQDQTIGYRYAISQRGRERAQRLFEISGYVGPAPVSLESYRAMFEWLASQPSHVTQAQVKQALSGLVLTEEAIEVAGMAVSSGRSLFLSGPPGNGKTTLGHCLHDVMQGYIWIPHCIAVEQNIIRLYDTHCHQAEAPVTAKAHMIDQRWVRIKRPFIVAGGEMTLESMDMAYLPSLRYYEAPLHMKANGGTFMIDDFGRQHVDPAALLNRWIIPLEHRIDFLTLYGGQKIQVPFLLMLIIATNLAPKDVTDPAFLRRIGYRIRIDAPTQEGYAKIFNAYAARYNLKVEPAFIARLLERYRSTGRELRSCEPRDLIERMRDICQYRQQPPAINEELLNIAWAGYFGEEKAAAA
jgi:predicted ATPase with chaperone activity